MKQISLQVLIMGKPTKTNQIHMTLRPKYGEHQVQHTTQDTKSNLLRMTLRPTEMSALPKGVRLRTPSPTQYKVH